MNVLIVNVAERFNGLRLRVRNSQTFKLYKHFKQKIK